MYNECEGAKNGGSLKQEELRLKASLIHKETLSLKTVFGEGESEITECSGTKLQFLN